MESEAVKRELDDSGCVQDEASPPFKKQCLHPNGYTRQVELLDLCDDVLLIIMRHCSPMELKALAFTCPRLARLSLERVFWQKVDARQFAYDRRRLRWLLAYAVHGRTTELMLMGHAEQAASCEEHNKKLREKNKPRNEEEDNNTNGGAPGSDLAQGPAFIIRDMGSGISVGAHSCSHFASIRHNLQRPSISHAYSEDSEENQANSCPSPVFTLCASMLERLNTACNLTQLALEYCNINCKMTGLNLFPSTLKKLSLKGTRCYNLPLDKTYLFKIQDYLPGLEHLDVSYCDWLEPASLLPLSKLALLTHVYMMHCKRLTEFVAYASLAARYGFKALKEIDFQGSPVGDSEVSAFGWVQTLEVIRLSAPKQPKTRTHEHTEPLEEWEKEEPEYLKKFQADTQMEGVDDLNEEINIQKQSASLDEPCGLGIVVCLSDIRRQQEQQERRQREERRRRSGHEHRHNRANDDGNPNNDPTDNSPATKRRKVHDKSQNNNANDEERFRKARACWQASGDAQSGATSGFRRISPPVATSSKHSETKTGDDRKESEDEKNFKEGDERTTPCDEPNTSSYGVIVSSNGSDISVNLRSTFSTDLGASNNEASTSSNHAVTFSNQPSVPIIGPSTSSKEPSLSSKQPTTSSYEASMSNNEPSTSGIGPSTSSNGPSTSSNGPSTTIDQASTSASITNLPSTLNNEPSTSSNQPSTSTDEASTSTNLPSTSSIEPSTSSIEPSTSSIEPSTSSNESSTSSNQPSTSGNDPGTSQPPQDPSAANNQNPEADAGRQRFQQFVRFRQNERPVIIRRHLLDNDQNENNNDNQNENANQNQAIPRHSVLYVSVAQQVPNFDFRNLYNCTDYNCITYDFRTNNPIDSTLITDSSVSRFGRSDGENVNYVHLGENQLILRYRRDTGARPDRSNLREIVANNYRFITDRSLVHLATAAPNLRFVDFRGTRVTSNGVENFLSLRPDCEVLFSPFQDYSHDGGDNND